MRHGFYLSAGLLTAEHRKRLGPAVWEFEWLISHETREGGKVLNGAPITAVRIAEEFGIHVDTVRINLARLEREGYIVRTPGANRVYHYQVAGSKKWAKSTDHESEKTPSLSLRKHRVKSGAESEKTPSQPGENTESESEKTPGCVGENTESYKEGRQVDIADRVDKEPSASSFVNRVKKKRTAKTSLPENFGISDRVRKWAAEKGYTQLEEQLEAFRLKAMKKNYQYSDWDAAFMDAIREDWAKLNQKGGNRGNRLNKAEQLQDSNLRALAEVRRDLGLDS